MTWSNMRATRHRANCHCQLGTQTLPQCKWVKKLNNVHDSIHRWPTLMQGSAHGWIDRAPCWRRPIQEATTTWRHAQCLALSRGKSHSLFVQLFEQCLRLLLCEWPHPATHVSVHASLHYHAMLQSAPCLLRCTCVQRVEPARRDEDLAQHVPTRVTEKGGKPGQVNQNCFVRSCTCVSEVSITTRFTKPVDRAGRPFCC